MKTIGEFMVNKLFPILFLTLFATFGCATTPKQSTPPAPPGLCDQTDEVLATMTAHVEQHMPPPRPVLKIEHCYESDKGAGYMIYSADGPAYGVEHGQEMHILLMWEQQEDDTWEATGEFPFFSALSDEALEQQKKEIIEMLKKSKRG